MAFYGGGERELSLQREPVLLYRAAAMFGPAATQWFKFLQNKVRLPNQNSEIAARVVVDQVLFAPTNLFFFLGTMSLLEGSDPRDKLKRAYAPTLVTNWAVWPWVQAINFKLVPLEHRVLAVNVVALGETCPIQMQST